MRHIGWRGRRTRSRARLRILVYAYGGSAQFQSLSSPTHARRPPRRSDKVRAVAVAAAIDAGATAFPTGRAARIGSVECFAVAIPTAVTESISGRSGLSVSVVILSK